jgi:PAS domain S-box-containing protein
MSVTTTVRSQRVGGPLRTPAPVILIVEDDAAISEMLREVMETEGYRVDIAVNGTDGLTRIEADGIDLVLLDLMLPEMGGLELCRRVRARQDRAYLPIIMVTALAGEAQRHAGFLAGADDYVTKPYNLDEVLDRVRAWVATRQRLVACFEVQTRLAAIVDCSNDAIIATSLGGMIHSWNPAAERLFGYRAEEVLGQSLRLLIPPDQAAELPALLQRIAQGERIADYETVRVRKDGRRLDVALSMAPLTGPTGRITGTSATCHDITERKQLEEQLRQAQKMEGIGQLAGGVAHDFNNLLTVINGFSELLTLQLAPTDPHRGPLEEILKAGERAAGLTQQLLAFSRRQALLPQVVDLNGIVADTEALLRRLLGEDIDLLAVLRPELGRVRVDPRQLQQVILNLAVNARDAMPQGGRLTIETANVELDAGYAGQHAAVSPGAYVMLAVSDTGSGMDAETQAHIFEPFFTTKEPGQGTGLGLSMIYGIVKQSSGDIWVYSEPGHGTIFKLYFPRVADEAEQPASPTPPVQAPSGTETILLVEDEAPVRSLARTVLEARGYAVLEASRGDEALRVAQHHRGPIHLLLTDVVMPGLGGPAVARLLTRVHPETQVLYMSGYTDAAVARHGVLEAGAALVQKPFTPRALAQQVRQVLDAPGGPTG